MPRKPRIGLLPLYLKLYDQCLPKVRAEFRPFVARVGRLFKADGCDVVVAEICCVGAEFRRAVRQFERADVDLIVTVHLAYSPSLESVDALAATSLPLLMLDTTMDAAFGRDVAPARIMYNHGIHGVMDLASMLRRRGKPFQIVAGHVDAPAVQARAVGVAQAAYAARCFRGTRALRIGESFRGMGDFAVDEGVLGERFGITVDQADLAALAAHVEAVTPREVRTEVARDRKRFDCDVPADVHERSVRVGLGLRLMLAAGDYAAFSVNFLAFDRGTGPVDTVPFLEISKAMARGIGYGGEGDVLTASLVGALARGFGGTTFTEIFCPDWQGRTLFLSHMGEINPDVAAARPQLLEKPFPFTKARNPAFVTCAPAPEPAVFVNLAPGPDNTFSLLVAPVDVLEDTTHADMRKAVRGWIRPEGSLTRFLERYSLCGGTHHSALVLGEKTEAVVAFAEFAGLDCCVIE